MSVGEAIAAREQVIGSDAGQGADRVPDDRRAGRADAGEADRTQARDRGRRAEGIGGGDAAASPVEYALAALASCQAITYRLWATKLGIELDGLEIAVEGDLDLHGFFGLDDAVRPGFSAIRIDVTPIGPSPERFAELADAVDAHCPVLDLIADADAGRAPAMRRGRSRRRFVATRCRRPRGRAPRPRRA